MLTDIFFILGIFLILASLIPLIRHDYWLFRIFEYPRLQKLFFNIVLLSVILLFYWPNSVYDIALVTALSLNLIYLTYQVLPFTIFGQKQIVSSREQVGDNNICILIANVFQENNRCDDYHDLINSCNPDVILMVETNKWWQEAMDKIGKDYPYQLKIPLENTYGMLLYSRLPLHKGEIKFLVEKDVPSIETEVVLKSGQHLKLYCLHPKPPVPQENPRSTERDREILMVGEKARESMLPVIVMGDLNDVAWSYTTELFGKVSGLLDPRRGRGFFNSFNAKTPFLRFPLDHIFCSADFSLSGIKRMDNCGSDHFSMCVNLQYDPKMETENEKPVADEDDMERAEEKVSAGGNRSGSIFQFAFLTQRHNDQKSFNS